ncbi:MAG: hypothetical protein ACE5GX_08400 [Thermoanaerobaculia bacterium]
MVHGFCPARSHPVASTEFMGGGKKRESDTGFFAMRRVEVGALAILILFSAVSFLPVWRELELAGVAVFGWLMAALMLVSPALMLLVFRIGRRP